MYLSILLLAFLLVGCSAANGFNGHQWGTSMEKVRSKEGKPFEESIASLEYTQDLFGSKGEAMYLFGYNYGLHEVIVSYGNLSQSEFKDLSDNISRTYGKGKYDVKPKYNPEHTLSEIYGNKVIDFKVWNKGNTMVEMARVKQRNTSFISITFNDTRYP